MSPEERIDKYKAAYERFNGRECKMAYSHGWYVLNGQHKLRAAKVELLTANLNQRPDRRGGEE